MAAATALKPHHRAERRRRIREPSLVHLLSTEEQGHHHVAVFDDNGNGVTSTAQGHKHRVRWLQVLPAADGHTHELTTTRASVDLDETGRAARRRHS